MKEQRNQRSLPELVTYAVSLIVLVIMIGGLSALWLSGSNEPPSFGVQSKLGDIEQRGEAYYLPIAVTNHGDQSAQEVAVDVTFGKETRSITLALIPGGATRSGTVVFTDDPTAGEVTTEVVSFISN